ncbi:MAG TPA: glycosyltransferase family 2 protein [Desulfomonilia bacterium]|nr:glycosyltransferase family 2 protein [Desulfomonilia bacterium]
MDTTAPVKLSVIIPCFNEEKNIESCLRSVDWADEILVVDSFSTDNTLEIARRFTDRIIQHEYINSAAQKNWAIPQAVYDWVLIVDCDERVTPGLREEIVSILKQGPRKDGYWIRRKNYLFGKEIRHSGWGKDSVLRLFRRDLSRYQEKRVHAEVDLANTEMLQGFLEHHSVSSLSHWVNKINRYTSWKAQDKYDKGIAAPVLLMVFRPPLTFLKDFILRLGILDGWRGFLIASMSAFADLVMTAKLVQYSLEKGRER